MDDSTGIVLRLVVRIVASYVRHHRVAADQVDALIAGVRRSLAAVRGQAAPAPVPEEARVPAVPVRRSVQRDYVVCLECGFRGLMLRRHLATAHGLDVGAYRARWQLAADHPIVAPSYAERRSVLAKQIRLGQPAAAAAPEGSPPVIANGSPAEAGDADPAASSSAPRRRGRPRRTQPAA